MVKEFQTPGRTEAGGRTYIGIGGWTFAPWRGVFYPDDLPQAKELEYASRKLDLDRDQRDVLPHPDARDVPQVGE
jgi:hypothetical protein